jgi:hypothetical protein
LRGGKWQYEPLSGAVPLGVDDNHAHVQPNGAYHYHGLPQGLLEILQVSANRHSPRVGWAADGFPIYARYGCADPEDSTSAIVELPSSYRLRRGKRPKSERDPGDYYDGTFTVDYEYRERLLGLDECNRRFTVTPEFPDGSYVYFLSRDWPVIPRCHRGTPSRDFAKAR